MYSAPKSARLRRVYGVRNVKKDTVLSGEILKCSISEETQNGVLMLEFSPVFSTIRPGQRVPSVVLTGKNPVQTHNDMAHTHARLLSVNIFADTFVRPAIGQSINVLF